MLHTCFTEHWLYVPQLILRLLYISLTDAMNHCQPTMYIKPNQMPDLLSIKHKQKSLKFCSDWYPSYVCPADLVRSSIEIVGWSEIFYRAALPWSFPPLIQTWQLFHTVYFLRFLYGCCTLPFAAFVTICVVLLLWWIPLQIYGGVSILLLL